MTVGLDHPSASASPGHVASPASTEAAREALKKGPRGALLVASTTLLMLLAGWLAFYFAFFLPRGGIR